MSFNVLVTGGAGFIGSHIVDALIEKGHKVSVFDNLDKQVHGEWQKVPDYLNKSAKFIYGDMRDRDALKRAIKGIDVIFHEASVVGVGQSMYEIKRYMEANTLGTAILWDILVNDKHQVRKIIIASSMSNYGEGEYTCSQCGIVHPQLRERQQFQDKRWELICPDCGKQLSPIGTHETKPLSPTSIYAISKKDQEEMSLVLGKTYKIPVVALRYFNVYGQRQALSNPYTGVAAIFSSRLLNNHSPVIFEDGNQSRDFIHIKDIVTANLLALEKPEANYEVFNVGTGRQVSILDVANILIQKLNPNLNPQIVDKFREGDIRHCYADISKIKAKLGFEPKIRFEEGFSELVKWVSTQTAVDMVEKATAQLQKKGLVG